MSDRVVRALTRDHAFRIITITSTETARAAARTHGLSGTSAEILGELVTGSVLARELMSPDLRMQVVLRGAKGTGSAVADAYPGGRTRGMLNHKAGHATFELGGDAMMQVTRNLARGDLHQGIVPVEAAEGVSGAFHNYFTTSEQVTTAVGLASPWSGEDVVRAGGYVVQMLPEGTPADLDRMSAHIERLPPIQTLLEDVGADADQLLARLLDGVDHVRVNDGPVFWGCVCDLTRVVSALATLPRNEIAELAEQEEGLDIGCDYCGKHYQVPRTQLLGLLVDS